MEPEQQNNQVSKTEPRYGNKEQTDSDWRGGERGITGERRGRVKFRNMYKGHIDKDNEGRIECGRLMVGQGRGEQWGEMGKTVTEQ